MPWCPQCKNEYREGITVCADCGCELIPDEEPEKEAILFGEKEQMEQLQKFLKYNDISSSEIAYDEKENVYELSVASNEKKEALKVTQIFLQQEAIRQGKQDCEREEEKEEEKNAEEVSGKTALSAAAASVYRSNEQKAKDNKSSAVVLLFTGCAGLLFLILCMTGVLPFQFRGFVYGVMGALFLIFIIMGIVSFKNSKDLGEKAVSENSLVDSMTKWCLENLDKSQIDGQLDLDSLNEEEKYFKRTQWMREKIQNQFLNLDDAFLDYFIDDIYEDVFED